MRPGVQRHPKTATGYTLPLKLGQVLRLGFEQLLEHLSGLESIPDQRIVYECPEGKFLISYQACVYDSLLIEDVRVHERGDRWRKLSEHDAGSPDAVNRPIGLDDGSERKIPNLTGVRKIDDIY